VGHGKGWNLVAILIILQPISISSETPPSKLGGIFQMYYLITFAHSSPQQADGVSCAAFMNSTTCMLQNSVAKERHE
jgi:hypothetical protein